jgi:nucleoside-diphosphate-sugar epimerase
MEGRLPVERSRNLSWRSSADNVRRVADTAFVTGGSGFIGGRLIQRLKSEGWDVRALARSDRSAEAVRGLGAESVGGDISDVAAIKSGAEGCSYAFHAAAHVGDWGKRADFIRDNVQGTQNALDGSAAAGVRRFVHVGTEAALLAGKPLVNVDESAPLRPDSPSVYPSTKAMAEQAVRQANVDGEFETVVVRPRFVWGPGDTTIVPSLSEAVKSGQFRWIGGGRHRTSTAHVDNVVEGLLLGAQRGVGGAAYFVTDGEPVVFREFVTRLLGTQGIEPGEGELPLPVAKALTIAGEAAWRALPLPGRPPLTRMALWVSSQECTIDISRARNELGYEPVKTIDEGLAEL